MRSFASSMENHAARSISGNLWCRPERGGHSIENVLLTIAAGSASPSNAHARTILPPPCTMGSSSMKALPGRRPVSSVNSRLADESGSSSAEYSPFGMDQAPRSFLLQNGPPGWARKTSTVPWRRRYMSKPALVFPMSHSSKTVDVALLSNMSTVQCAGSL